MSPKQVTQPGQRPPARSPEAIEAALAAQRAQLVDDVEALAAVMAPEALKSVAHRTVQGTAAEWRRRAGISAARLKARASLVRDDPLVREAPAGSCPIGCAYLRAATARISPASVRNRLAQLVDDARDGEPVSLAIVTGAVAVLAGLSAVAVVKAVRR